MRNAFVQELTQIAKNDPDVILLTGDLGFSVFENFMKELPEQYVNCGVAEQNMIGTAAGMALSGKKVFVYSIVPFAVMRCFEQIRNDVCMHNLNVTIVGVGGGFSYGLLGATHHAIEDIAITRVLPNMTVAVPSDPQEVKGLVRELYKLDGPSYLRLGKRGEPNIGELKNVKIGKSRTVKEGNDITIITAGPILKNVMEAAEKLEKKNISVRVISAITVKPLDKKNIISASKETETLFVVEEHSKIGGLGDAVIDLVTQENNKCPIFKLGANYEFSKTVGSQDYLKNLNGLSAESIQNDIERKLNIK